MMKTEQSSWRFEQAKKHLAGGVASSLRTSMKPLPLFVQSAKGARIRDVDDNEFIDYLLAYGPLILGHAHDGWTSAILSAMQTGYTYGLQHDGEMKLAERLAGILPCAEKTAFSGSGTEAVMLALRLARASTGKRIVVRFAGHYHGWSDSIYTAFPGAGIVQKEEAEAATPGCAPPGTSGQSANSLKDILLLPWNDPDILESTLRARAGEIAAVISEPVMCNSGCIAPKPGYLQRMRDLTAELGIVLILDEVITGFRLGLGGAHERFRIRPDLVTIGKAMGGGVSISAVCGKAEIMNLIEDGTVGHLGTLNGNCAATAAALATIHELSRDEGGCFVKMETLFARLDEGIRDLLDTHGHNGVVNRIGPVFNLIFTDEEQVTHFDTFQQRDAAKYTRFAVNMLEEGVLLRQNGLWYISTAHEQKDIEQTLEAVDRSLHRLT